MSERTLANREITKTSRKPFVKGFVAGALTVAVLSTGIWLAHAGQSEEISSFSARIIADQTGSSASIRTFENVPGMEKFWQHKYLQSAEWKAFVGKVNESESFLPSPQKEFEELKHRTVFPDLKVKLAEIESTLNEPYELSPLGFKDSYVDVAVLQDVQYLCKAGHKMKLHEGNLLLDDGTDNPIPSLTATVLQIPANSADVTLIQGVLEAGIDTYCPK